MASSSRRGRGGCRHGSSILRAYYVKVGTLVKRSSARLFSPTTLTPLPGQYLKSTTHSRRNRGLREARPVLPAPLYHPPSARYQIRNSTRDNPSLTSGSEIFLLALPSSSLLTSSPSVNRDAPCYHPPAYGIGEEGSVSFPLFHPSFVYRGMYHAIFLLAILWTRSLLNVYFPSNLPPFTFLKL